MSLIGYGTIQLHQWAKVICSSVRHAEAQTWRMKYTLDNAKETGATLLLITPSAKGHILDIADKVVRIPATAYKAVYNSEDEYVPTVQMMGNQFEQALLVFFDVIVMMLSEEMGISNEEMEPATEILSR